MQTVDDLVSSLDQRGVKLWAEDGQLRFQAPRGVLVPDELRKLRTLKAEIIEFLEQAQSVSEVPLVPRVAGCSIPLTAAQLRFWNYLQKHRRLSWRMCVTAVRVFGQLDTSLLRNSIEAVVRRHESLRTRFVAVDGIPRQQIDAACEYQLEVVDLSEVLPINVEGEVKRLAWELVEEKIDLSVGPLFAARLFRLSHREHVLILALDHMISDGESNAILGREIWILYNQAAHGLIHSLPQLPVQFGDYAIWQQRMYGAWMQKHGAYWKQRLSGAPRIQIPPDDGLVDVKDPMGAALHIPFGDALSVRLHDLARRERTLPAIVVLTIYVAMISRCFNQRDLIVGFASNGRFRPELASMIGVIVTALYLRIEVTAEDRFMDLLKRVDLEFRSAYDHQDFSGWLPDIIPGCANAIGFNWTPVNFLRWADDLQREADSAVRIQAFQFRKALPFGTFGSFFTDTAAGITWRVEYRPDRFAPSTMEWLGCNLQLFAEEFTRCPLAHVASVSMKAR